MKKIKLLMPLGIATLAGVALPLVSCGSNGGNGGQKDDDGPIALDFDWEHQDTEVTSESFCVYSKTKEIELNTEYSISLDLSESHMSSFTKYGDWSSKGFIAIHLRPDEPVSCTNIDDVCPIDITSAKLGNEDITIGWPQDDDWQCCIDDDSTDKDGTKWTVFNKGVKSTDKYTITFKIKTEPEWYSTSKWHCLVLETK